VNIRESIDITGFFKVFALSGYVLNRNSAHRRIAMNRLRRASPHSHESLAAERKAAI